MKPKRGRPPIHPDARKTEFLRFRVDADLADLLKQMSADLQEPMSKIIRDGIEAMSISTGIYYVKKKRGWVKKEMTDQEWENRYGGNLAEKGTA